MSKLVSIDELNDQLQLKPSFKVEVENENFANDVAEYFKKQKFDNINFKQLDDHIWLSISEAKKTYYSPRLHLEVEKKESLTILYCTFGPDPNLWTMFMFIHFFLALSFIGLLVWYYTNITLGTSNILTYVLMGIIAICWISLYLFARKNREKAAPQSKELLNALSKCLS